MSLEHYKITLTDICMPLDEAKEWKEGGGRQDTIYRWWKAGERYWLGSEPVYKKRHTEIAAAPTAAEAMIWMAPFGAGWDDGWFMEDDVGRYPLWDRLIWLHREGRL